MSKPWELLSILSRYLSPYLCVVIKTITIDFIKNFNTMREIKSVNEFQQLAAQDKPVLLDFYADWCGPCQVLLPIVEGLATKHADDVIIAKVNVDTVGELAQQFGVRSIPSLFFVQGGEIKEKLVGLQTAAALEKKIEQYTVTA